MDEEKRYREDLAQALPDLTDEQIAEVSPHLMREIYAPGTVIIHQGDAPDRFYIILRGQAEVWHENMSGNSERVDIRKPGEYFGEIGLLQHQPRTATVRAPEANEVEVLAMDHQDFQVVIDESRATEMHVAQEMIKRLINLSTAQ